MTEISEESILKTKQSQQHPVYKIWSFLEACRALKIPVSHSTKSYFFEESFLLNK